ncbi:GL23204 [Drosophila persimilis]|uniref:GL23204 n=1 Tax=Drosophila persimilis TaxID=7234 RepID=B4G5C2_DROPE|nr:GL23204 [Drosophila persimilis]
MSLANQSQNLQLQLEQLRELQQLQEQQQQQQQLQEQHPLLSAIAENNYAQTQRVHYPNHYYPSNHYHYQQQGRPLLAAAGSSHNGAYAATAPYSGHSGHGHIEPSVEYELQQTPPSGGFTSYHASAGSAPALSMGMPHPPPHPPRPPPHPPAIHSYSYPKPPPPTRGSAGKKSKKNSSGVMSALTLLSFFFFLNLLQNCIKDHMSDMNPTVMVLTDTASRNRFNKLAEMNSREQTSSPTPSWQQAALVPVPDSGPGSVPVSSPAPVIVKPTVVLQSPYSGAAAAAAAVVTNKPQYHQNQHQHHLTRTRTRTSNRTINRTLTRTIITIQPRTHIIIHHPPTSAADFYPNRTAHIDHSSRPDFDSDSDSDYYQHHYYPERHRYSDSRYSNPRRPWSYGGAASHAGSGGSSIRQRYSSAPWSSASLGAQSGVSSYLDNAQRRQGDDDDAAAAAAGHGFDADADDDDGRHHRRRGDAFYTRIN